MATGDTSGGHGGSVLNGLLAPLRLPERVIDVLESLAEAAREVRPMRAELTRVREQTEPLAGLVPAAEQILGKTERVLAVAERISGQAEPLEQLLPSLERLEEGLGGRLDAMSDVVTSLESVESDLHKRVVELIGELRQMHETIVGLKGDVETLTARMPDANRGPLDRARDALTSSTTEGR